MCRAQCVLVVALLVGLAHSWDIALTVGDRIEFYTENGTKIETAYLPSQNPAAIVYDEVHNMLLYVNKQNSNDAICGYNMTSKDYKCYVERNGRNIHGLAFDPATETLFFTATNQQSIYTFSFKHGSTNNVHGNLLIQLDNGMPTDIAVDSCRGYVYWVNKHLPLSTMERARFDGSGREVIIAQSSQNIHRHDIHSVAIDQQLREMIFVVPGTRTSCFTYSKNLNGGSIGWIVSLLSRNQISYYAYSKHYLFAGFCSECPIKQVWRFSKPGYSEKKIIDISTAGDVGMAANYKMIDHFQGISECSHVLNNFCVNGTLVYGQPLCKCTPGYTGDRCEISLCENYCSNGNCSFTEHGQPTCRCEAGYSGERCEVNVCHGYCSNSGTCSLDNDSQPICECQGDYVGHRCEISAGCLNYCSNGNCSFTEQGQPTCRCEAGYSGERCEVNVCHGYCSNSGTCSLDDDSQPICQCHVYYVGQRCEISAGCLNYCFKGNCSFTEQGLPTCRCEAGYSGERCEVNVCHGYCSNSGTCSLDNDSQPICECQGDYVGHRCEISNCLNYCFRGNCSFTEQGLPTCGCEVGYSGERCEVNVCNDHCLNSGTCFINEEDEPACECVGEYEGERCEVPKVQNQPAGQSTLNHLGEAEKCLTLADLLEIYRQRNNIYK